MGLFDAFKKKSTDKETESHPKRNENYHAAMKGFKEFKHQDDEKAKQLLHLAYEAAEENPFDKHSWYNEAVEYYYSLKQTEGREALEKCKELCKEGIAFAPEALEAFKEEYHGESLLDFIPPNIQAFKRLAVIYEEEGEYSQAIEVCDQALEYGLRDGTAEGFQGRKEKLLNKRDR